MAIKAVKVYEKGYTQNTKDCGGHFRECMGNLIMAENMTEAVCIFQLPISRRCVAVKHYSLREHNKREQNTKAKIRVSVVCD